MAIKTSNASSLPVVDVFQKTINNPGKPATDILYVKAEGFDLLRAGHRKLSWLFSKDQDGDFVLKGILQFILTNAPDELKLEVLKNVKEFSQEIIEEMS